MPRDRARSFPTAANRRPCVSTTHSRTSGSPSGPSRANLVGASARAPLWQGNALERNDAVATDADASNERERAAPHASVYLLRARGAEIPCDCVPHASVYENGTVGTHASARRCTPCEREREARTPTQRARGAETHASEDDAVKRALRMPMRRTSASALHLMRACT